MVFELLRVSGALVFARVHPLYGRTQPLLGDHPSYSVTFSDIISISNGRRSGGEKGTTATIDLCKH